MRSIPRSDRTPALPSPGPSSTLLSLGFQEEGASSEGVPWGGRAEGGGRGTEWEGPQLGSVTHWHYWCWADGSSGFQFSFSTETWALGKPPWDWHLDAVGRAPARSLDTLGPGPGSTVDLLGDLVSHFPIATLSSVLRKMGTLFPTLPISQIKRERGVPRALKRIMGRQGVIMALVSNPLNSLKTRERGQGTERSWAACSPCQVSQACGAAREGREVRGGEAEHPRPGIQPLRCTRQGCCEPRPGGPRCPGSPLAGE